MQRLFTPMTAGILLLMASPAAAWIPRRVFKIEDLEDGTRQAWLCVVAVMLISVGLMGWARCKDPLGVLIDERNRYSISRLQAIVWTVIVLGGLVAGAVANHRAGSDPGHALDIVIEPEVLSLLGISVGSAVTAQVIKSAKAAAPQADIPSEERFASATPRGMLAVASAPELGDLVESEGTANPDMIDIGKVQMLFVTAIVLGAYVLQLWDAFGQLGDRTPGTLVFSRMPSMDQGIATLLLISHAGYLVNKAAATKAT